MTKPNPTPALRDAVIKVNNAQSFNPVSVFNITSDLAALELDAPAASGDAQHRQGLGGGA